MTTKVTLTASKGSNGSLVLETGQNLMLGAIVQTKAERDARVAKRRQDCAGSGFLEFGGTFTGKGTKSNGIAVSNDNLYLTLGDDGSLTGSRSYYPVINAHGIRFEKPVSTMLVGAGANAANELNIALPPASDDPLLPSFQSLVFAEVFSQAVTGVGGSGRIFPRGFVQNLLPNFSGATLTQNDPASFSAYGKWDVDNGTAIAGYSLLYSTASQTAIQNLLEDPETAETLWMDTDGTLVQDLIRFRVTPGLGNNWISVDPAGIYVSPTTPPYYDTANNSVAAQGPSTSLPLNSDLVTGGASFRRSTSFIDAGVKTNDTYSGYTGESYYIPILLWQHGNTGAYHPEFNPSGFGKILNVDDTTPAFWYDTDRTITSRQDCFDFVVGGDSASGISGHPQGYYHDFRYPDQLVRDLRYNANRVSDINAETGKAVTNFLNSSYSNIQVKGERPGRLEVINGGVTASIADGGRLAVDGTNLYHLDFTSRDVGSILVGNTGKVARVISVGSASLIVIRKIDGTAWVDLAEIQAEFEGVPFIMYKRDTSNLPSAPAAGGPMLWCDIIGDPANYPDWLTGKVAGDLAFQGVPCVVDVNSPTYARQYPADITPVGTPERKSFRMTRDFIGANLNSAILVVSYDGTDFTTIPFGAGVDGQFSGNAPTNTIDFYSTDWVGGGAFDDDTVFFVFYTTEANPTVVANLEALIETPDKILAFNEDSYASALSHITGRIGVHSGGDRISNLLFTEFFNSPNTGALRNVDAFHTELSADIEDTSPGVKVAPAPRNNSGRLAIQMYFQELLRDPIDGTYADDGIISPVSNLSTKVGAGSSALTLQEGTVEIATNRLTSEH